MSITITTLEDGVVCEDVRRDEELASLMRRDTSVYTQKWISCFREMTLQVVTFCARKPPPYLRVAGGNASPRQVPRADTLDYTQSERRLFTVFY